MDGKRELTPSQYLDELNATLDQLASERSSRIPHFNGIPSGPTVLNNIPASMPPDPLHVSCYLQALSMVQRHYVVAES